MKKIIALQGKKIEYTAKKSRRARNMRLTICCDARLVVTVPWLVSFRSAERFILQKASWVIKTIERLKRDRVYLEAENYYSCKTKALKFVKTKVEYFNQFYDTSTDLSAEQAGSAQVIKYNRVRVKNHKRLWGSCSAKNNLNFNYRLMFLPEELADYVVVHELCHLREMNHSKKFWALVGQVDPDYKEKKKRLKQIAFR